MQFKVHTYYLDITFFFLYENVKFNVKLVVGFISLFKHILRIHMNQIELENNP